MMVSILKPVIPMDWETVDWDLRDLAAQKQEIIQQGTVYASETSAGIISEKMNAYVADIAAQYGADLQVETTVSNGVPTKISLTGTASPYMRSQITSRIEQEIGIGREAVNWR
jgi:hypothetical protein